MDYSSGELPFEKSRDAKSEEAPDLKSNALDRWISFEREPSLVRRKLYSTKMDDRTKETSSDEMPFEKSPDARSEEELDLNSDALDRWFSFETPPSLVGRKHYSSEMDDRRKEINDEKPLEGRAKINESGTHEVHISRAAEQYNRSDVSKNEQKIVTAENLKVVKISESIQAPRISTKTLNKFLPSQSSWLIKLMIGTVVTSAILFCLFFSNHHVAIKRNEESSSQVAKTDAEHIQLATVDEHGYRRTSSNYKTLKEVPDLSFSDESLLMFEFSIFRRVS